ncbi:MAG: hypothetical protein NTU94_10185 [Planctomycetota bacterium]|nr:hypothetical protein [Planctomycetota bacterium]
MTATNAGRLGPRRWTVGAAVIAIFMASSGSLPGAPSLEELLNQAMEGHPAILLAKAKVAQAQAELGTVQAEVIRQLIALRGEYEAQEKALAKVKQQADAAQQGLDKAKTADLKDLVEAEAKREAATTALAEADAKLNRLNTELEQLQALMGRLASEAPRPPAGPQPDTEAQQPSGPVKEKMIAALEGTANLDFSDTPMPEAVKLLREACKVPIMLDAGRGLNDLHVSLQLKGVKLGAALQAIEDLCPEVAFVVRDYGILATQKEHADHHGFLSAVSLWKANTKQDAAPPAEEKPAAPAAPPAAEKPPAPAPPPAAP